MSLRRVVPVVLIAMIAFAAWAWRRNTTPPPSPMPAPSAPLASGAPGGSHVVVESGGDPGVEWHVPTHWSEAESNPMRLATYGIPAVRGDRDPARCAVYYFGPGQGGDPQTNVERWISEFESPGKAERAALTVDGMAVSTLRMRGTHLAHVDMSSDHGVQSHQELYGAIVEGPSGMVFFKMTGPEHSVDAAVPEFDRMLASLKRKR